MIDGTYPLGHKIEPEMSIPVSRLAVETNIFPLFEVEYRNYTFNYFPEKTVPVDECIKIQRRYRHLFKNGSKDIFQRIQNYTDMNWKRLNEIALCTKK